MSQPLYAHYNPCEIGGARHGTFVPTIRALRKPHCIMSRESLIAYLSPSIHSRKPPVQGEHLIAEVFTEPPRKIYPFSVFNGDRLLEVFLSVHL
jgi:hypothetical protein